MLRGKRGSVLAALLAAALALTIAGAAAAERVTTSQIPLTAALVSPCTADVVTFTGTAVLTVTEDDLQRVRLAGNVQDPQAVGLLYPYNFKDQLSSADVVEVGGLYEASFTDRLHFIRLGSGGDQSSDDLFVTVVVSATLDSSLVLRPDKVDYQIACK
jgi:hypothetical protein